MTISPEEEENQMLGIWGSQWNPSLPLSSLVIMEWYWWWWWRWRGSWGSWWWWWGFWLIKNVCTGITWRRVTLKNWSNCKVIAWILHHCLQHFDHHCHLLHRHYIHHHDCPPFHHHHHHRFHHYHECHMISIGWWWSRAGGAIVAKVSRLARREL